MIHCTHMIQQSAKPQKATHAEPARTDPAGRHATEECMQHRQQHQAYKHKTYKGEISTPRMNNRGRDPGRT